MNKRQAKKKTQKKIKRKTDALQKSMSVIVAAMSAIGLTTLELGNTIQCLCESAKKIKEETFKKEIEKAMCINQNIRRKEWQFILSRTNLKTRANTARAGRR